MSTQFSPPPHGAQVEGPRMRKLREVVAKCLHMAKEHFNKQNPEELRACFAQVQDERHQLLLEGWCRQVVDGICRNFELEFDKIATQRKLVAKLNALDQLDHMQPKSQLTGQRRNLSTR